MQFTIKIDKVHTISAQINRDIKLNNTNYQLNNTNYQRLERCSFAQLSAAKHALYPHQSVVTPLSDHHFSVQWKETSFALHNIAVEHTLKPFSVAELQHSSATLVVVYESSLVVDPYFFSLVEIAIVEWIAQFDGILVVEDAIAVQLIAVPLSLVGDTAVWIVQSSTPMHQIFFPISTILSTLIIVECAISIPQALKFSPLVPPFGELFLNESGLRHLDWHFAGDAGRR